MYLALALVASACALEASAFLVPLEVSKAAEQAKSELASLLATTGHTVDLDCPGCPFFGPEDSTKPETDVENKIHLKFDVDAEQGLTVNNLPIIPSEPVNAGIPYIVSAPQIRVEDGEQTSPVQLDFAWEKLAPISSADEPDKSIIPTRFTILGLHGYPVKVDTLAIDLLQTSTATSIARITNIPFEETPGAFTCDTAAKWSLCRLRAIIATRLQSLMEAAKERANAAKGWVSGRKGCGRGKFAGKDMGMDRHSSHGHDGHHGHHHRLHRFGRILYQTLRFFVIPALLGVIGGLMASAIGMLVGRLISYLWIRFHRGGHRGNVNPDIRVVEIIVDKEEKDALMFDDGDLPPPPGYTDLEAGTEAEKH